MKTLIIGPAYPLRGGIASFNESLCRSLNAQGINAEILSFSLQYPSLLFPGKTQYESGPGPKDIKITTMINSINPLSWIRAVRFIKKTKPDFVIIRYWIPFMAPCLGAIARAIRKKIKVVVIADNVIPHEKRFGDTALTRYFINSCDAFIAMSNSVIDELKLFTNTAHISFLPHPIYDIYGEKVPKKDALNELGLNPLDKHILFFGFIRKYKGLDILLEAMGKKSIVDLGVKLIIAGEFYEDRVFYENLINKYNLEDLIIMNSGFIPAERVKYYFCAADIVVQPYRSASQSGITQIAYNFERPMLVTNTGGLAETVPHGQVGYVIEPDPVSIADAISDFYLNQRENKFQQNAAELKGRFSWKYFVDGLMKLALNL